MFLLSYCGIHSLPDSRAILLGIVYLKLTKELLLARLLQVRIVKVADKVVVKLNDFHVCLHADVLINRVDAAAGVLAHGSEAVDVAGQVCVAALVNTPFTITS